MLVVLIPALGLLFRHVVPERIGIIVLSALVTHTGWHWMLERGAQVGKFPFPALDAALLASARRGIDGGAGPRGRRAAGNGVLRRWLQRSEGPPAADGAERAPRASD